MRPVSLAKVITLLKSSFARVFPNLSADWYYIFVRYMLTGFTCRTYGIINMRCNVIIDVTIGYNDYEEQAKKCRSDKNDHISMREYVFLLAATLIKRARR